MDDGQAHKSRGSVLHLSKELRICFRDRKMLPYITLIVSEIAVEEGECLLIRLSVPTWRSYPTQRT